MAVNHILIVDDAETIREMLQDYLLSSGFSVECAETAEEAYKKIKERKPDLILLDVVLPDMLGTDLCVQIKQKKDLRFIPIIMCSANAISTQDKMKGFDIGADDYVTKPFVLDELNSRIRALLRRVELDKTKHIAEEQVAQAAPPPLAVEVKTQTPPLKLGKYLGYSFTNPKEVYSNLASGAKKMSLTRLFLFLFLVSLFPAVPQIIHGSLKGFFATFFSTLLNFGLMVALSALICNGALTFLFKKKCSWKLIVMVMQVAATPFILYKFLGFIFVLTAGYQADISHFSAGVALFFPVVKNRLIQILLEIADIFPVLTMLSAALGLSLLSDLSPKKTLPLSVVAVALSLGLVAFLP